MTATGPPSLTPPTVNGALGDSMTSSVPGVSNANNINFSQELEALQIWGKSALMFC